MTSASKTGGALLLAAILLAGTFTVLLGCSKPEAVAVEGSAKAAKLKSCVEPTPFMRRNHMELIEDQRDVTVHQGVRVTRHSLAACIDCHVQYDKQGHPVPVNAQGQFCNRCHARLAVRLDCFQCHSPIPQGPQPANLALTWPDTFGPGAKGTDAAAQKGGK